MARGASRAPFLMAAPYGLRAGVSFCEVSERLLFLYIVADRYFALENESERALRRLIGQKQLDADALARVEALVRRGLLEVTSASDHTAAPCAPPPVPVSSLLDRPGQNASRTMTLLAVASAVASVRRLKRRPLRVNLAAAVADRTRAASTDEAALSRIAAAFARAGHLVSTHDRCLAQSLAVMRMISARGLWAQLVIGVMTGPFAAHCWVQSGSLLINDRVDRVRSYTPILVV